MQTFHLEIVPDELLAAIAPKLAAVTNDPSPSTLLDIRVQFVGTRAGSEVSSNSFRYPVEVCHGCLTRSLGACTALAAGVEVNTGGVCVLQQDGILDCCTDAAGASVCPAVPATPPA
jgi:hypothetical protein